MKFTKYHALGNDYLVLDPVDCPKMPEGIDVVKICHRNFGLGSDGILYGPGKSDKADFKLQRSRKERQRPAHIFPLPLRHG